MPWRNFHPAFLLLLSVARSECLVCDAASYLYKTPGDVMVSAVIGAHSGEDCTTPEIKGFQLIQAIITAVEAVRMNNLIPGLTLGLSVYDSCTQSDMAQKSIISALVDAECNEAYVLGILLEDGVEVSVRNLTTSLGITTFTLSRSISNSLYAKIIARTLFDLHWMPIHKLYSSNDNITTEFLNAASYLGMCVYDTLPLTDLEKIESTDTVVIISDSSRIKDSSSSVSGEKLLFAPLDEDFEETIVTDFKFSKLMVVLPASLEITPLFNTLNITEKLIESNLFTNTKSHTNLLQVQTVSNIMKVVASLKTHIKAHCETDVGWSLCSNLPKFPYKNFSSSVVSSVDIIKSNLKFLRVNGEGFEGAVILEETPDLQRVGALKLAQHGFILDTEINITKETKVCKKRPVNDSLGYDCTDCSNFNIIYRDYLEQRINIFTILELKQEAWVAALLTISTVGVLCCIAIAIFIVVRICKKDMLEGNPGFSFLLLISIMFMYCSILPYSLEVVDDHHYYKGIFCGLKIFGTSLSYSLVFSIMLARSFMLASCDEDGGFMSHVNGYLQTVLCFFIAAVQVALTLQFWAINWLLLSQQQCVAMSKGNLFLFLLAYDMFLLLLLLSVSPFILKSKRNYHEGCYFAVSTYICLAVWITWCTGYTLLPQWEEICVCCGLVATATIILVSVFIPRTYLMLTGIVRDHIVSTLPSLNHTTTTSIVDMNYRSTQALYDSVTLPRGSNYYAERPTTPSTSKMEDDQIENTYERYERSPSPRNITRF